ncbi:hypothetical protein HNR60_003757 [Rhodopseudomonas rhenobacensis]|uniref:Uncharacterized protein n=1 Tax=Rhodopseudomonas rhenobacensis TaxID=87461 RepID=A0A7W7Z6K7_9BRAD|nr:hypothetical protein [Rhodopseudomonas rhenobacensis]
MVGLWIEDGSALRFLEAQIEESFDGILFEKPPHHRRAAA